MRATTLAFAIAFASISGAASAADPFNHVWVFGDSSVDTGWYKVSPYSGLQTFDTYISVPAYGVGRPTNSPGRMSVQVLAHYVGTHAVPANQGGTNYATSGARNYASNSGAPGLFPNAVPTGHQIRHYLNHYNPNGKALYVISSGGNDVSFALANPSLVVDPQGNPTDATSYITDAANTLAARISDLQTNGAKYIIVANLAQSFGPDQATKDARAQYNTALKAKLDALHVKYAWGDVDAVRTMIKNSPSTFGLSFISNVPTQVVCTVPAASTGITTDWALVCSTSSTASTPTNQNINPDQALFADDNHFATGGHKVLGTYYYCLAQKTWPQLFSASSPTPAFSCSTFFPPNTPS